jgi:hypothetical protein
MFSGCATAIITPMNKDGSVDEAGLRELVRWQEECGIRTLVPCGSTGESATLNHQEHLRVIEVVLDEARHSKVIAGSGSNATSEAIHLSKGAQDLGAHGLLSISPYYNKPTQAGIIKHYEAICAAVDIPTIVYNIPSRTGSNITAATETAPAQCSASAHAPAVAPVVRTSSINRTRRPATDPGLATATDPLTACLAPDPRRLWAGAPESLTRQSWANALLTSTENAAASSCAWLKPRSASRSEARGTATTSLAS